MPARTDPFGAQRYGVSFSSAAARAWRWLPLLTLPVAAFTLLVAACAPRTEIRQILADPRAYEGRTITVQGNVTDTFSLIVVKYFQIDDGTGAIGVVSDKPLPSKGQHLTVTGDVREAFSLGDRSITVVVEKDSAIKR